MFELHHAKKICFGSEVAPQAPIPLYPVGQQECFWIPGIGLLELHNAKKYCLGSGVAPKTPITLCPIRQQRWFRILIMGVFELYNTGTILFRFWGGAPNTHTSVPYRPAKVFSVTWDGGAWTAQWQNNIVWFLGWRPKHPYHCTP